MSKAGTTRKKITYAFIGLAFTTFPTTIPAKRNQSTVAWLVLLVDGRITRSLFCRLHFHGFVKTHGLLILTRGAR